MENAIVRLNKQYSQVEIGGKIRIWNGRCFLSQRDFVASEAGNGQMVDKKYRADTALWLNSLDRNMYQRYTFYPGPVPNNTFNLWKGWPLTPKPEEHPNDTLFIDHLTNNICSGRGDYTEWLIQWLAQLIQEPEVKMGTAIVLRGLKGTGKSAFADIIGTLCGKHYVSLSHSEQALGRFNSIYEQALLVCFEEAFWAGNKRGEGVLKNLITCNSLSIERKGLEAYTVPNFSRYFMVTNSDWAVPATLDERRFLVLDVQDHWKGNEKMFSAMFKQLENGGYAELMHSLLNKKITVDLRNPPMTQGLRDQIELSEPIAVQFFREWWNSQDMEQWQGDVWARDLEHDMVRYCNRHGDRHPPSWQYFTTDLKRRGVRYEKKQITRATNNREIHLIFDRNSAF